MTEPSKYPVLYHSESRNRDERIEDLHDMHLLNAWKKVRRQVEAINALPREMTVEEERAVVMNSALWEEVKARGLDKPREEVPPAEDEGGFGA